ncbi:MAG: MFS transporter [Candidatus Stahlbacteria bacterium]|nr:MAG: MFS transporter [Candidatus Stahlbacteria bacterium]
MLKLNSLEKNTFKNHLIFSATNGIVFGGLMLQDIIARKTLLSSNLVVTFVTMVWPVANLFSIYWGEYLQGRKDRRTLFLIAGFLGRLSLILTFFVHTGKHFVLLLLLVYSFNAFIIPVQNSIFQFNYRKKNRGILFGLSQTAYALFLLIASFLFGRVLDYNEFLFRPLFAAVGLFGYLGILALRRIKVEIPEIVKGAKSHPVVSPIITTIYEFRNNKPFLWYEIGFMVYGFGFLMVLPIIPQFLVNKLGMTYTQISIGKVIIANAGIALFAPVAGFIHKRLNPIIFSGLSFIILGFYPLLLNLSIFQNFMEPVNFVYLSFGVFSIGMTGVFINWQIGSIYFARGKDSAMLQSVHVTLTAIRGLFAPLLGYFLMSKFSDSIGFVSSSIMFFLASIIMFITYIRCREYLKL